MWKCITWFYVKEILFLFRINSFDCTLSTVVAKVSFGSVPNGCLNKIWTNFVKKKNWQTLTSFEISSWMEKLFSWILFFKGNLTLTCSLYFIDHVCRQWLAPWHCFSFLSNKTKRLTYEQKKSPIDSSVSYLQYLTCK